MIRAALALALSFAAPAHAALACCLVHRAAAPAAGAEPHAADHHAAPSPDAGGDPTVRGAEPPDEGARPCPALAARSSPALRSPEGGRPPAPAAAGPSAAAPAAPPGGAPARTASPPPFRDDRVVLPPSRPLRI